MKKAIIHIGAHKTGTTSIQVALHNNSSFLNALGVYYPVELTYAKTGMYGQHSLSFALRGIYKHYGRNGVCLKSHYDDVTPIDFIANLSRDTDLILSSEDFYDLDECQISKMKQILLGFDVRIIFYIRRQDESSQALYQTSVVNYGYSKSFEEYLALNEFKFDYYKVAQKWSKIFGKRNLTVKRYGKEYLLNGNSLVDFVNVTECLLGRSLNFDNWIPVVGDLNQGVPEHIVSIIKYLNNDVKYLKATTSLRDLAYKLYKNAHGRYSIASPSLRKSINDIYMVSNQKLAAEFMNIGDEKLFNVSDIDDTDHGWQQHESSIDYCYARLLEDLGAYLENVDNFSVATINNNNLMNSNKLLFPPQTWQSESAYADLQAEAQKLTPDEWISIVGSACEQGTNLGLMDLPRAPSAEVQTSFVGASGRLSLEEGGRFYKFVLDVLHKEGLSKPGSLMDFGCGWGRFTRLFQRDVKEGGLYGVDPWNYAINLCRSHYPFASFMQSNFLPPLNFRDNTFDVVVSYSVFSHLVEHAAQSWIIELSRVLRPGGLLIATTHGPWVLDNVNLIRSGKRKPCNKWEEGIVNTWPDASILINKYNKGDFVFINNKNNPLPLQLYGNAFIPKQYVENIYGNYLEYINYMSDRSQVSQSVFVLKKR